MKKLLNYLQSLENYRTEFNLLPKMEFHVYFTKSNINYSLVKWDESIYNGAFELLDSRSEDISFFYKSIDLLNFIKNE